MESVLGGGVLLAAAAALWLVYLVPNWLRRSEYLATERNAVRLQQTIRILAETAETPEAVRLENLAKARALEARLRKRPVAVGAPALLEDPADPRVLAAARMRRTRIATTVVIAVAALVLLSQVVVMLVAGIAAASSLVVILSAGFVGSGLWLQGRLAAAQRAARRPAAAATRSQSLPVAERVRRESAPALSDDSRAWTPQPIPQPLHQLRRAAALRAAAQSEREARVREAQAAIAEARASAAAAPVTAAAHANAAPSLSEERPQDASRDQPVRVPSRFAAMGVLDDAATSMPDIDGALARRRAS